MTNHIDETKFESIYDELMYEIQDVIDLFNHILCKKTTEHSFLDLLSDYSHRPANDNWPVFETKDENNIKVNQN